MTASAIIIVDSFNDTKLSNIIRNDQNILEWPKQPARHCQP